MLRDQFPQLLQPGICEGQRFLLVSPVDPETAVFGIRVIRKVPQQLLVLAEDLSGTGDGEHVSWRRYDQPSHRLRRRQLFGRRISSSMATAPPGR